MGGTKIKTEVVKVVDGDTITVKGKDKDEKIRILALDTEESQPGGDKPMTPWGKKAKEEAQRIFVAGKTVTLEFPGKEAADVCWERYRDNYGRAMAYVYAPDGSDYQKHMIGQGYSPYFVKYGYAEFAANHKAYTNAEVAAQKENKGLWDQISVNGSEMRNYPLLSVWWHLRAQIIDEYRSYKAHNPKKAPMDVNLDYDKIVEKANAGAEAVIFTELAGFSRIGGAHGIIRNSSLHRPFSIFMRDIDEPAGQKIVNLISQRYIAPSKQPDHPRRSYAYIKGLLQIYGGRPELVITSADQIWDGPPK
ncbi:MAG TPA: thermonuclease family protein [Methanothrix sp.]|nr:thermonuclease family protein [Methanothrix sp.]HNU39654.1 thermonuclease family protein [Methanothrix sp.]HPA97481.1 thermonuclease family protein [Methanothrix sp.]